MKKLLILLLAGLVINIYADEIHFKDGSRIINCTVVSQNPNYIYVQLISGKGKTSTKAYGKNKVEKIQKKPINKNSNTKIIDNKGNTEIYGKVIKKSNEKITQEKITINPNHILFSLVSFAISYDYFQEANDYDKSINEFQDFNDEYGENIFDTENLETTRNRKKVIAFICLGSGILNTVLSFEKVKVTPKEQGLTLSYKF